MRLRKVRGRSWSICPSGAWIKPSIGGGVNREDSQKGGGTQDRRAGRLPTACYVGARPMDARGGGGGLHAVAAAPPAAPARGRTSPRRGPAPRPARTPERRREARGRARARPRRGGRTDRRRRRAGATGARRSTLLHPRGAPVRAAGMRAPDRAPDLAAIARAGDGGRALGPGRPTWRRATSTRRRSVPARWALAQPSCQHQLADVSYL